MESAAIPVGGTVQVQESTENKKRFCKKKTLLLPTDKKPAHFGALLPGGGGLAVPGGSGSSQPMRVTAIPKKLSALFSAPNGLLNSLTGGSMKARRKEGAKLDVQGIMQDKVSFVQEVRKSHILPDDLLALQAKKRADAASNEGGEGGTNVKSTTFVVKCKSSDEREAELRRELTELENQNEDEVVADPFLEEEDEEEEDWTGWYEEEDEEEDEE